MATFLTLNELDRANPEDELVIRQGDRDYKVTVETLAAALSNSRWKNSVNYLKGSYVIGSDDQPYRARVSSGPDHGGFKDPTANDGTDWIKDPVTSAPNFISKNSKIDPIVIVDGTTITVGTELSAGWVVDTDVVNPSYIDAMWNADSGTISRDIPIKNGMEHYDLAMFVGSVADASRLPKTSGVTIAYDNVGTPTAIRITIDFATASDVFSAKLEISTPTLHNVAATSGSGGATGGGTDEVFFINSKNVTADFTLTSDKNAGTFGPITIDNGVTVTVEAGATLTVV